MEKSDLTLLWNNLPFARQPFIQDLAHYPLDRLSRHPIAKLARGFARMDFGQDQTALIQIKGTPHNAPPEIDETGCTISCWAHIPTEDLTCLLHQNFCRTHLSSLRGQLSPFGLMLCDHLTAKASGTWRHFSSDLFVRIYHHRLRAPEDDRSPEEEICDSFFYHFQSLVFNGRFPWPRYKFAQGCSMDERRQMLDETGVIIKTALPLITHIPGFRHSFLKERIIEDGLMAKAREVSCGLPALRLVHDCPV